jgi:uncharacterized protein
MADKQRLFILHKESPLFQVFVALMIILGVGGVLSVIFLIAGMQIFCSDLGVFDKSLPLMSSNDFSFMRYILIMQDISIFIIPSILILRLLKTEASQSAHENRIPQLNEVGLVLILAICLFPITGFTGQINSAMHFPVWLSGVEQWIIEKEKKADSLIGLMVVSGSLLTMLLNMLTLALIPAIAEELLFRGVFQRIFADLFKSGHFAVWFTAFLFSTLHFQFFGFIPRFILGLVFGYLFFWSGTLWLPVISHFFNNAIPVVITYIQGAEKLNSPADVPLWQQAIVLPLPVAISLVILFYFRKNRFKNESVNSPSF